MAPRPVTRDDLDLTIFAIRYFAAEKFTTGGGGNGRDAAIDKPLIDCRGGHAGARPRPPIN